MEFDPITSINSLHHFSDQIDLHIQIIEKTVSRIRRPLSVSALPEHGISELTDDAPPDELMSELSVSPKSRETKPATFALFKSSARKLFGKGFEGENEAANKLEPKIPLTSLPSPNNSNGVVAPKTLSKSDLRSFFLPRS